MGNPPGTWLNQWSTSSPSRSEARDGHGSRWLGVDGRIGQAMSTRSP